MPSVAESRLSVQCAGTLPTCLCVGGGKGGLVGSVDVSVG